MTYATQDDLVARYGDYMLIQLTDRAEPATGEIVSAVVTHALDDADAVINGYLMGRYKLPLNETPRLVSELAQKIAIHNLHRETVSEKIRREYEDAISQLKQIGTGVIRLDVAGVEPESSGASGVQFSDRPRDMTPDNMKGWI